MRIGKEGVRAGTGFDTLMLRTGKQGTEMGTAHSHIRERALRKARAAYSAQDIYCFTIGEYEEVRAKLGQWHKSPLVDRWARLVAAGGRASYVPTVPRFGQEGYRLGRLQADVIDAHGRTWWNHTSAFWIAVGHTEALRAKLHDVYALHDGIRRARNVADAALRQIYERSGLGYAALSGNKDDLMYTAIASGFYEGWASTERVSEPGLVTRHEAPELPHRCPCGNLCCDKCY